MTRDEKEILIRIVNVIIDIANTSGIYSTHLHEQLTTLTGMVDAIEPTPDASEEDE